MNGRCPSKSGHLVATTGICDGMCFVLVLLIWLHRHIDSRKLSPVICFSLEFHPRINRIGIVKPSLYISACMLLL